MCATRQVDAAMRPSLRAAQGSYGHMQSERCQRAGEPAANALGNTGAAFEVGAPYRIAVTQMRL